MKGQIKRTIAILMAVCSVLSLTAIAASAQVTVYEKTNFGGKNLEINDDTPYFGAFWNDKISSIKVSGSDWQFCEHTYYYGKCWVLAPGDYPDVSNTGISSIRKNKWIDM